MVLRPYKSTCEKTQDNTSAEVDNSNLVKDRLLILVICLVSTTPCPLLVGVYKLFTAYYQYASKSVEDQTFAYIVAYILFNSNFVLIQCFEEICLLIMSKEFQKLVKTQFIKNTQTNTVATTFHVSQSLQQQRMRQINIQRNNLVN
uniref:G_PROTEIN_RECEP_F1_2 domain-containing protein n=1 Tax=Meloidogyne hapla TaxID=6305 RepID=A0A1I8BL20_MELHA